MRSLADRAGYDVQRVRGGAWLVQQPPGKNHPLTLQHVGSSKTGPFLLVEDDGTSGLQRRHRQALNNHLADEHLAWVLQKLAINCVLDVGANQGQFARRLRQLVAILADNAIRHSPAGTDVEVRVRRHGVVRNDHALDQ